MVKAVFVNHCHPEMKHVGAMRFRELAKAMVEQGHQIILLTETLNNGDVESLAETQEKFKAFSWAKPFYLSSKPVKQRGLCWLRSTKTPIFFRKILVVFYYLFFQGVFHDWYLGSKKYWNLIRDEFKPDFIYGTFGNTDALKIAKKLAAYCDCPWMMDVKDPWSAFIPRGLRRIIAFYFHNANQITSLSLGHQKDIAFWFKQKNQIIDSGFPDWLLTFPKVQRITNHRITLIGGIYNITYFRIFLNAISGYHERNKQVELHYVGSDARLFMQECAEHLRKIQFINHEFLPYQEYIQFLSESWVNFYIGCPRGTFHHKVYELLALGRPIGCVGGSYDLSHIVYLNKKNAIIDFLTRCESGNYTQVDDLELGQYTWTWQAKKLINFYETNIV